MADAGVLELEAYLVGFLSRLEPGERRKTGMRIAAYLQRARAKTIGANTDPDGQPFTPRKPRAPQAGDKVAKKKRSIKDRKMFLKARTTKYLRKQATASEASVGYAGAMARLMTVHQEGRKDRVSRAPGSPVAQYPMRRILGLNEADREEVLAIVLEQLSE